MYKLVHLPSSRKSYDEIVAYLTNEVSPRTAEKFIDDFEQQVTALVDLPFLYPEYEHNDEIKPKLRKIVMSDFRYIVFYRIDEGKRKVLFYKIIHSSQDIHTRLKKEFS
jgi:plasmid stabilization system protein ParE